MKSDAPVAEIHTTLASRAWCEPSTSVAQAFAQTLANFERDVTQKMAQECARINTHVRLFDLVRQARATLHGENLITDEEYAWLSGGPMAVDENKNGSPSPRRLEDYDDLRAQLSTLQDKVERLTFIGNTLRLDLGIDPSIPSDDAPKMVQALQESLSSLRAKLKAP